MDHLQRLCGLLGFHERRTSVARPGRWSRRRSNRDGFFHGEKSCGGKFVERLWRLRPGLNLAVAPAITHEPKGTEVSVVRPLHTFSQNHGTRGSQVRTSQPIMGLSIRRPLKHGKKTWGQREAGNSSQPPPTPQPPPQGKPTTQTRNKRPQGRRQRGRGGGGAQFLAAHQPAAILKRGAPEPSWSEEDDSEEELERSPFLLAEPSCLEA